MPAFRHWRPDAALHMCGAKSERMRAPACVVVMFSQVSLQPRGRACDMVFNEGEPAFCDVNWSQLHQTDIERPTEKAAMIPPGPVRYPNTFRSNPRRAKVG